MKCAFFILYNYITMHGAKKYKINILLLVGLLDGSQDSPVTRWLRCA